MKEFIHHLFVPKESNNHRAKILHNSNLFLAIVFLLLTTFFTQQIKASFPSVLGIQVDISSQELLNLTNLKRQENGAPSLSLNEKLSEAASKKADDMFAYNYWAHNSPTGKTPWVFIKDSGYEYIYAGENLAKGFSSASDVVNAWMASPDHKANMLSANYQDVGFAVKVGTLNGEETVLIVQEFGSQNFPIADVNESQEVAEEIIPDAPEETIEIPEIVQKPITTEQTIPSENVVFASQDPLIDSSSFSFNINMIIIAVFIFALLLDMIIVGKKKILRFVGHNIDHISYFILILALVGVLSRGVII